MSPKARDNSSTDHTWLWKDSMNWKVIITLSKKYFYRSNTIWSNLSSKLQINSTLIRALIRQPDKKASSKSGPDIRSTGHTHDREEPKPREREGGREKKEKLLHLLRQYNNSFLSHSLSKIFYCRLGRLQTRPVLPLGWNYPLRRPFSRPLQARSLGALYAVYRSQPRVNLVLLRFSSCSFSLLLSLDLLLLPRCWKRFAIANKFRLDVPLLARRSLPPFIILRIVYKCGGVAALPFFSLDWRKKWGAFRER